MKASFHQNTEPSGSRGGWRRGSKYLSPGPLRVHLWLWGRKVGEVPMVPRSCACESPFLAATALGPECHCPLNLKHKWPFWRGFFVFFNFQLLGLHCSASFSLVGASRGYSSLSVCRRLIAVASRCGARTLGHAGFSGCGVQA